jgi:hypothetical protein
MKKINKVFCWFFILLLSVSAGAESLHFTMAANAPVSPESTNADREWENSALNGFPKQIIEDSNGNLVLTGQNLGSKTYTTDSGAPAHVTFITKLDKNGALMQSKEYRAPDHHNDIFVNRGHVSFGGSCGWSLAETLDGNYVLVGDAGAFFHVYPFTARFDKTQLSPIGEGEIWDASSNVAVSVNPYGEQFDRLWGIKIIPNLEGGFTFLTMPWDIILQKLNQYGQPLAGQHNFIDLYNHNPPKDWEGFEARSDEWSWDVTQDPSGNYVIVGKIYSDYLGSDGELWPDNRILFCTTNSNLQMNTIKLIGEFNDQGNSVIPVSDGYVIAGSRVTGYADGRNIRDALLMKVNKVGTPIAQFGVHIFGGEGDDTFNQVLPTGNGYVAIGTKTVNGNKQLFMVTIDENGGNIEERLFGETDYDEEGVSMVRTQDGGLAILASRTSRPINNPVQGSSLVENKIWVLKIPGITITSPHEYQVFSNLQPNPSDPYVVQAGGQIIVEGTVPSYLYPPKLHLTIQQADKAAWDPVKDGKTDYPDWSLTSNPPNRPTVATRELTYNPDAPDTGEYYKKNADGKLVFKFILEKLGSNEKPVSAPAGWAISGDDLQAHRFYRIEVADRLAVPSSPQHKNTVDVFVESYSNYRRVSLEMSDPAKAVDYLVPSDIYDIDHLLNIRNSNHEPNPLYYLDEKTNGNLDLDPRLQAHMFPLLFKLATLVKNEDNKPDSPFKNKDFTLRVTSAWRDHTNPKYSGNPPSHLSGRAIDLSVGTNAESSAGDILKYLPTLAKLAIEAGFDYVYTEGNGKDPEKYEDGVPFHVHVEEEGWHAGNLAITALGPIEISVFTPSMRELPLRLLAPRNTQRITRLGPLSGPSSETFTRVDINGDGITDTRITFLEEEYGRYLIKVKRANLVPSNWLLPSPKFSLEVTSRVGQSRDITLVNEIALPDPNEKDTYVFDWSLAGVSEVPDNGAPLSIQGFCPIDLIVTDPNGFAVSKSTNSIPGAKYVERDIDGDGDLDDEVTVPNWLSGQYKVTVIPESSALPNDTYSVEVSTYRRSKTLTSGKIADLSSKPISVFVSQDQISLAPTALAGGPYKTLAGTPIVLDASKSFDPDDNALWYRWDLNNDGTWDTQWSKNSTLNYNWNSAGKVFVRIEVTDGTFISTDTSYCTISLPPPPPPIRLDPLDFGDVYVKKEKIINLTIRNDGTTPINLGPYEFFGSISFGSPDFRPIYYGYLIVEPGGTGNISVTFTPSRIGNQNVTCNFLGVQTHVSGRGVGSQIQIHVSNVDFGKRALGNAAERQVSLYNSGNRPLTITSIIGTGSGDINFTVPTLPFDIDVAQTRNITIKCTASCSGQQLAKFTIQSNDPLNGTTSFEASANIVGDVRVQWKQSYGGWSSDVVYGDSNFLQTTSDDGYIITGDSAGDLYLMKTDSKGKQQWNKTYDTGYAECGDAVQQTTDGGYIVVGDRQWQGYSYGMLLIKTDASGNQQWQRVLGGTSASCVKQTADGGYIIVGYTGTSDYGSADIFVVKTNQYGNQQWSKTININADDYGDSVLQTTDGGYVLTVKGDSGNPVAIVKIDSNGNEKWRKTNSSFELDTIQVLNQTSGGDLVSTGKLSGIYYLLGLDANGNEKSRRIIGSFPGYLSQQTSDGGYLFEAFNDYNNDYLSYINVTKTDSDGKLQWCTTIPSGSTWSYGIAAKQVSDGGFAVGWSAIPDKYHDYDIFLTKIGGTNEPDIQAPIPDISFTYQDISSVSAGFPDGIQMSTAQEKTITIQNNGLAPLTIVSINRTSGSEDFSLVNPQTPTIIQPNQFLNITIQFNSTSAQPTSATFTITSNDPDEPEVTFHTSGNAVELRKAWQIQLPNTFGSSSSVIYPNSIQQTTDHGYIIVGSYISPKNGMDVLLMKTNQSGDVVWSKTYGGQSNDYGYSVIQTSDQGFLISGNTFSFGPDSNAYLIKTDEIGNVQWEAAFGGNGYQAARSAVEISDGEYIVTGQNMSYTTNDNLPFVAKVLDYGIIEWSKTYEDPSGYSSTGAGYSILKTNDGGYIIETSPYVIKIDSAGNEKWIRGLPLSGGFSIEQTTDGGFILACSETLAHYPDFYRASLIKLDSNGNDQWIKTYEDLESRLGDFALQTSDGGYVLIANKDTTPSVFSDEKTFFIKTDANGNQEYNQTYSGYPISIKKTSDDGLILLLSGIDGYGPTNMVKIVPTIDLSPLADSRGPYEGFEGSPITFDASKSYDPDGNKLVYRWDFDGDGNFDTAWLDQSTVSHTWNDDWQGQVSLQTSDGILVAQSNSNVTVRNVSPQVEVGGDILVGISDTIAFNASFTDAGLVDTHTLLWDFGDKSNVASTLTSSHSYSKEGVYTVVLTVTDNNEGSGSDALTVIVKNGADVEIHVMPSNKSVDLGSSIQYPVLIKNLGSTLDTFKLSLQGLDATWFSFSQTSVVIQSGETSTAVLTISPPKNAALKEYDFQITATSTNQPNVKGIENVSLVTDMPKTLTVPITVTSNPVGSNLVKIDGIAVTTPATFDWTPNSQHTIEAFSTVSNGSGTQLVWTNWSDSGLQSHNYIVPATSEIVTANYQTQYYLKVDNGNHGVVSGEGWYNTGSQATFNISSTTVSGGIGIQYVFLQWQGSGTNSYTGSDANHTVIMNSPKNETALWKTQYLASFKQSGSTINPKVNYSINDGSTLSDTVPFSIWVDTGQQITYSYQTLIPATTDVRYLLSSTSPNSPQTANSAFVVIGNYKIQYQVSFSATPPNSGTVNPMDTTYYDSGSKVLISASPKSGYAFYSWNATPSSNIAFSNKSQSTTTATINAQGNITATFAQIVKDNSNVTFTGSNNVIIITGGNNIIDCRKATSTTIIKTGAGNNIIYLGEGDNVVKETANGNDIITAGNGNNNFDIAGTGNYQITSGSGNNQIKITGDGNNIIKAGDGNNIVTIIGKGNNQITAGKGNNQITTGSGNDAVTMGNGNNNIQTGAGNDNIIVGSGNNYIDGGPGYDVCVHGNGTNTILNCEKK